MTKDFLDQVEQQLVAATERGGKRRGLWRLRVYLVRVPTFAITAAGVTAVTATALAATLALPAGHAKKSPPPLVRTVTERSVAPANSDNFQPKSFTAIGEFTWWLMGPKSCGNSTCLAIARTTDGGMHFVWLPAPATDNGVQQLRFDNAVDGYAFDPQLWMTTDGGTSWSPVNLGGQVTQLMASGEYVYAIVVPAGGGGGRLMRSVAGTSTWTTMTAAGNLQDDSLWVQDQYVLVESFGARGDELLESQNNGDSFTAYPAPPAVRCDFVWASTSVIWEPCATGTMSGIWRSSDGGATSQGVGGDATRRQVPQFPNSMAFAAASPDIAVMGADKLYRTVDDGQSYQAVAAPTAQQWQYLGFTDATHGVAIGLFVDGGSEQWCVYYTIDAGKSYHFVPIDVT